MGIKVEYDIDYTGGNYMDVGQFVLVPSTLIDELDSVEAAFEKYTGVDPVHIIHYSNEEE